MHQLERVVRGERTEIVALDQRGAQAPLRRVAGDAGTVDAGTDDQHVEGLPGEPARVALHAPVSAFLAKSSR